MGHNYTHGGRRASMAEVPPGSVGSLSDQGPVARCGAEIGAATAAGPQPGRQRPE